MGQFSKDIFTQKKMKVKMVSVCRELINGFTRVRRPAMPPLSYFQYHYHLTQLPCFVSVYCTCMREHGSTAFTVKS